MLYAEDRFDDQIVYACPDYSYVVVRLLEVLSQGVVRPFVPLAFVLVVVGFEVFCEFVEGVVSEVRVEVFLG